MANLLCFGDSNTWGVVPNENRRYTLDERWTGLLARNLPEEWYLVENGQPGRTSVYEDKECGFTSGLTALKSALKEHSPQLVIIMLGTNDLKASFGLSAEEVSFSVAKLVEEVKRAGCSTSGILLVSPPAIYEQGSFARLFFSGSQEKSKQLAHYYRLRSKELGCEFFDASQVVSTCSREGVHWPAEQHVAMAEAISSKVLDMISTE